MDNSIKMLIRDFGQMFAKVRCFPAYQSGDKVCLRLSELSGENVSKILSQKCFVNYMFKSGVHFCKKTDDGRALLYVLNENKLKVFIKVPFNAIRKIIKT